MAVCWKPTGNGNAHTYVVFQVKIIQNILRDFSLASLKTTRYRAEALVLSPPANLKIKMLSHVDMKCQTELKRKHKLTNDMT